MEHPLEWYEMMNGMNGMCGKRPKLNTSYRQYRSDEGKKLGRRRVCDCEKNIRKRFLVVVVVVASKIFTPTLTTHTHTQHALLGFGFVEKTHKSVQVCKR